MSPVTSSPTTALSLGDDPPGSAGERRDLPDPVLPKPGHLLAGKYRVDGLLGRGGMGVVAAGHQLSLDRPVAIKFLRQALVGSARQRFTREAMAVARMQSEHVVQVFDAGEEDGLPFIVMERLVGSDLAAELERGPLLPELAVTYLLEACEAIAEAHSVGIVHRDIKPSNLFIAEGANGRRMLKVLDFGVSKWLGSAPDGETPLSTSDQGLVGTPAYVSPEQLTTPAAVDGRTDVWALGVVLYQCLSGKRPFQARGIPQLCAAILTAAPPEFPSELRIPNELFAIVQRCLRKKPAERYRSVEELAAALAAFSMPKKALGRMLATFRKRPALGLLPVIAALVLGAFAWARSRAPSRVPEERPKAPALAATPVLPPDSLARPTGGAPVVEVKGPPPSAVSAPKSRQPVVRDARRASVAAPGSAPPVPSPSTLPAPAAPAPSASAASPLYRR